VHVLDVAEAHPLALEALRPGQALVCDVGSGVGHSVLEVARAVEAASGRRVPVLAGPRRPGDPAWAGADTGPAARPLGWRPARSSLAEIARSAWEWHRGEGGILCNAT